MLILLALTLYPIADAAFCGSSAIPYSFEVLADGGTVLGCARPNCFGWDSSTGGHASSDAGFINMNDRADGFIREGPMNRPPFNPNDPRVHSSQTADCATQFTSQCGPNQWMGGVDPNSANGNGAVGIQCCSFSGLADSVDRGVANVNSGQIVIGGEVEQNGVQSSFDYIKSMEKTVRPDGSVGYDVSVGRFPCQEIPVYSPPVAPQQIAPPVQQAPPPVQQPVYYQPQQPYYYPPGASGYYCFSDDTKVDLVDGSVKRMDELEMGDWVLSFENNRLSYADIKFWLHRMPQLETEFLKITTADGNSVKLTSKHYIYKTDCSSEGSELSFDDVSREAVFAEDVQVGECLYTLAKSGRPALIRVESIEKVNGTGIYAPMTSNGKILVNGIHASCHSVLQNYTLQNSFFAHIDYLNQLYNSYFGASEDSRDVPFGLETIVSMAEYVLPKNLVMQ